MKTEYSTILKVAAVISIFALLASVAIQQASASHVYVKNGKVYKSPVIAPSSPDSDNTISTGKLESIIHSKVNDARAKYGLPSLSYNSQLEKVAQYRSDDMASKGYFSHVSPSGERPSDVAKKLGFNCKNDLGGGKYTVGIGENIYKRSGGNLSEESIANAAFDGWMKSEGHRKNILSSNYNSEAIAFSISGNSVYVTQNFC